MLICCEHWNKRKIDLTPSAQWSGDLAMRCYLSGVVEDLDIVCRGRHSNEVRFSFSSECCQINKSRRVDRLQFDFNKR